MSTKDTNIIKNMMSAPGYSNINKFKTLKMEWDLLRRPIPLLYFDYIGIAKNVLELTLELDYKEYEQALEIPRYPRYAIVRLMAGAMMRWQFILPNGRFVEVFVRCDIDECKRRDPLCVKIVVV